MAKNSSRHGQLLGLLIAWYGPNGLLTTELLLTKRKSKGEEKKGHRPFNIKHGETGCVTFCTLNKSGSYYTRPVLPQFAGGYEKGSYVAHHVVHFTCDNIFVETHGNKKAPNEIKSHFQVTSSENESPSQITSSENGTPSQVTSSEIGGRVIQHSGKWHADANCEGSAGGSL
jgi:hypothetical protein